MRAARDVCPTRLPADAAAPNLSGSGSAKSPLLRRSRPATARLASGGQETRLHQQVIAHCEEFDTCHLSSGKDGHVLLKKYRALRQKFGE